MKTSTKIILGLLGISPFPIIIAMFAGFFYIVQANPTAEEMNEFFKTNAIWIFLFNILGTLYFGAVHVIYIVLAARKPDLEAMRVTWIIALLVLGPFAMPFYWYHHIWHDGWEKPPRGSLGLG